MTPADRYSGLDRLLHRMAFAGLYLQREIADIADRAYAARLNRISPGAPVFITSLPRAGTTLLLETVAGAKGFASHTYRDMPFLLCPLMWNAVSAGFRREGVRYERAHGDGMAIGYDSPEAFEEIIWKLFFPDHYDKRCIRPWRADEDAGAFRTFFARHMRKIVWLRLGDAAAPGRYVSKNNANIARMAFLRRLFPDCRIVVPFRHPLEQAVSLRLQHLRFLDMHARSRFVRQYMEWLGHLEFGENLRPIAFAGFCGADLNAACNTDFWLRYWIAAFEQVLAEEPWPILCSYERLGARPAETLQALAAALGEPADAFAPAAARLKAGEARAAQAEIADRDLLARAEAIHAALLARAIGPA